MLEFGLLQIYGLKTGGPLLSREEGIAVSAKRAAEESPRAMREERRANRAAARAKVTWKRNGFRHSYISYRVAALKDVPAVALECGNSPQVIFSNYRALATDAEAKEAIDTLDGALLIDRIVQVSEARPQKPKGRPFGAGRGKPGAARFQRPALQARHADWGIICTAG